MYEVEVKYRLSPEEYRELVNKLTSMGAKLLEELQEQDIYFSHPCRDFAETDEALRLRVIAKGPAINAVLTYKGPRIGSEGKTREELNVEVSNPETLVNILEKLGFRKVAEIRKRRTVYTYENYTIALDHVERLGYFVEIETVTNSKELIDRCVNDILNFAENNLGLTREKIETKTYLELMLSESA